MPTQNGFNEQETTGNEVTNFSLSELYLVLEDVRKQVNDVKLTENPKERESKLEQISMILSYYETSLDPDYFTDLYKGLPN